MRFLRKTNKEEIFALEKEDEITNLSSDEKDPALAKAEPSVSKDKLKEPDPQPNEKTLNLPKDRFSLSLFKLFFTTKAEKEKYIKTIELLRQKNLIDERLTKIDAIVRVQQENTSEKEKIFEELKFNAAMALMENEDNDDEDESDLETFDQIEGYTEKKNSLTENIEILVRLERERSFEAKELIGILKELADNLPTKETREKAELLEQIKAKIIELKNLETKVTSDDEIILEKEKETSDLMLQDFLDQLEIENDGHLVYHSSDSTFDLNEVS
jgi:hypothetical protein